MRTLVIGLFVVLVSIVARPGHAQVVPADPTGDCGAVHDSTEIYSASPMALGGSSTGVAGQTLLTAKWFFTTWRIIAFPGTADWGSIAIPRRTVSHLRPWK